MAAADAMTIEELASASGMTVRNIRAHQGRGLLPPPQLKARVGYYGDEHLARLRLIAEMQDEGFKLRTIARLLEHTGGDPRRLLHLKEAVGVPFETEQPQVLSVEQLLERFGEQADEAALAAAVRTGALVALEDGSFQAPAPSRVRAAEELVRRGVPLARVLAVDAKVRESADAVAREFTTLFLEEVWKPFAQQGYPEERWPEVTETIERLRPLSSRALLSTYQQAMGQQVEQAFGRVLERLARAGSSSD